MKREFRGAVGGPVLPPRSIGGLKVLWMRKWWLVSPVNFRPFLFIGGGRLGGGVV